VLVGERAQEHRQRVGPGRGQLGCALADDHRDEPAALLAQRLGDELLRPVGEAVQAAAGVDEQDRKSTRLNSSHVKTSYAVFCLKKKKDYKVFEVKDISNDIK